MKNIKHKNTGLIKERKLLCEKVNCILILYNRE